jgi:UDP-N-acetyl-D-glucosamine dehydrogenase
MSRKVAIVGAGYVGVPLAQVFAEAGNDVLLVDVSPERVARINNGDSYIEDVPSSVLGRLIESGRL